MKPNDKRIAHLRNLGNNRDEAIRKLKKEMQKNPNFLEVAEITDSHKTRDGGLLNKEVAYVAGICGCKEAKCELDSREDIYHLIYFTGLVKNQRGVWEHDGGTIYSNSLECVIDYKPFKNADS